MWGKDCLHIKLSKLRRPIDRLQGAALVAVRDTIHIKLSKLRRPINRLQGAALVAVRDTINNF